MQNPAPPSRFSRDEFCHLIDSRLQELEAHQEARRKYAAVLAALRINFEDYQKTRLRKA